MLLFHQHFFSLVQIALFLWYLQLMHHAAVISFPSAGKRTADACVHTGRILQSQFIMTRLKNTYSNAAGSLMQSSAIWLQHFPLLERNTINFYLRATACTVCLKKSLLPLLKIFCKFKLLC